MRRTCFLTFILFAALLTAVTVPAASGDTISLTLDPVHVEVAPGKTGAAQFTCDDVDWLGRPGEPRIPWKRLTVLLPPDADLSTVSADVQAGFEPVAGTWTIEPLPPDTAWVGGRKIERWPRDKTIVDGRDAAVYESDALWPEQHARVLHTGRLHKWQLATIGVPLVKYNPVTGDLLRLTGTEVSVTFDRDDTAGGKAIAMTSADMRARPRVQRIAANFDQAAADYGATLTAKDVGDGGYTIITRNTIESASTELADFVSHKTSLGYTVQVITEDEFGGGSGNTAAENIRSWLQSNYEADDIEFVLLIGDPRPTGGTVPMKAVWPWGYSTDPRDKVPCDFYYAELTGDWDDDGDGWYGERLDDFGAGGVDIYWEVMVGRIPYYSSVDDITVLDSILAKTVYFETRSDTEWMANKLISIPDDMDYNLGENIRTDILEPAGWPVTRVYDDAHDWIVPTPEYLYNWSTHGESYEYTMNVWGTSPYYGLVTGISHGTWESAYFAHRDHTDLLDDDHPSFTFAASCDNSYPEYTDNLTYALLKEGGICTIGATRLAWGPSADVMLYKYVSEVVGDGADGVTSGQALHDVKQDTPIDTEARWSNVAEYSIYGDPSLRLAPNLPADTDPPDPDPAAWASPPQAVGSGATVMSATTAEDRHGVEYYFDETTGNGNDSGWQTSPYYAQVGVTPSTRYEYRVRTRDKWAEPQNVGGWSDSVTARTGAEGFDVLFSEDLVAHWRFDEDSGPAVPDETGNYHGTKTGGAWAAGAHGNALDLDGDDYVSISGPSAMAQVTFSFWLKVDQWPEEENPVMLMEHTAAGDGAAHLVVETDGAMKMVIGEEEDVVFRGRVPALNTVHHLVVTYDADDNTVSRFYIDGAPAGNYAQGHQFPGPAALVGDARFGYRHDGLLDDYRIYDRVLSASEVASLYESYVSPDSDSDGLSDEAEAALGLSPTDPDTDNDGLSDGYEVTNNGQNDWEDYEDMLWDPVTNPTGTNTNAFVADTDEDGIDDGTEVVFGYDPLDSDDTPAVPLSSTIGLLLLAAAIACVALVPTLRRQTGHLETARDPN